MNKENENGIKMCHIKKNKNETQRQQERKRRTKYLQENS